MRNDLKADVAAELDWDPRVDNSNIGVAAHEGAVTLCGSVGNLRHIREAQGAARRVHGVTSVRNHLTVHALADATRLDAEIGDAVRQALTLNATVPATIRVNVSNGVAHLAGTATWQHQREEAELVCAGVSGVRGIADEIALVPVPPKDDMQRSIISAYRRNASLTRHLLSVDTLASGIVILSGAVTSWGEHDDAVATAWSAPGVTKVDDRILLAC
jgi:osmotically-inducible protein OsmY